MKFIMWLSITGARFAGGSTGPSSKKTTALAAAPGGVVVTWPTTFPLVGRAGVATGAALASGAAATPPSILSAIAIPIPPLQLQQSAQGVCGVGVAVAAAPGVG